MKRLLIIGSILVIVIGSLLVYLLYVGQIRFNYPDKVDFPILGIDISHHQGAIRWEELKSENISFVIMKATEGGDYKDPLFEVNWTSSKAEGYKTGAYHFYRFCKSGKEQAMNFLETVPNEPNNLPPTIDLEFGGNCGADRSNDQLKKEINEFLEILNDHYKKRPIIYSTQEFYDQFLINDFKGYAIWIRDIYMQPKLSDGRPWLIWQFANRGHLEGIDGHVDLNVLNGKSMEILQ
jgi:lysozyme